MEPILVNANDVIFRRGIKSDCMYRIESGRVGIFLDYGKQNAEQLAVFRGGKLLGEMGVFDGAPRSGDAIALTKVKLVRVDARNFSEFAQEHSDEVLATMVSLAKNIQSVRKAYKKVATLLATVAASGETDYSRFADRIKAVGERGKLLFDKGSTKVVTEPKANYAAGAVIYGKGEVAEGFYRIVSGEVSFYYQFTPKNRVKAGSLKAGELFGEFSPLSGERREFATVAKTAVSLEYVHRDSFETFIKEDSARALRVLRNLSADLRVTTQEYCEVIKIVEDFLRFENNIKKKYTFWDEFTEIVNAYGTQTQFSRFSAFGNDSFRYGA